MRRRYLLHCTLVMQFMAVLIFLCEILVGNGRGGLIIIIMMLFIAGMLQWAAEL